MKEQLQVFKCDNCSKKSKESLLGSGYPYKEGWVYLHKSTTKKEQKINGKIL